jgi:hypothetical protein
MRPFLEDVGQVEWSPVWVDWTCLPWAPWREKERIYVRRTLRFTPMLLRDCAFEKFSTFESRAWILLKAGEFLFGYTQYTMISRHSFPVWWGLLAKGFAQSSPSAGTPAPTEATSRSLLGG